MHPKIIVTKEFFGIKILVTAIYLALEIYYGQYISFRFDYMGFLLNPNLLKYVITKGVFLFLLAFSLNIYKQNQFLYSIYLLLILFFYIPNAILFSLGDFPPGPFVSNTFFVSFFLLTPYIKFPRWKIPVVRRHGMAVITALALLLLVPVIRTFRGNIHPGNLFLSGIYEAREIFTAKMKGILAYFYNLEAKTIVPAGLVFFMIRKRHLLTGLFILILLYLFVISGNKLVYFTPMIVIFFFYVGKNYVSKLSNFFLIVLLFFIFSPLIDYLAFDNALLEGVFINRFFFIPALLTQFYFDFFNGHPFFFAETHLINHFVHSPYDLPAGYLITKVYWNQPDVYANNGIVSDGFMNLGYAGVGIFSFIFSLLFALFSSFKLHKGYYGIFFSYIYILLSAPLLTCFITGGILLFILLCYFVLSGKGT